jgi:hypothetical protein
MRLPPFYTLFCVLVLALFAYTKYQGWALSDSGTTARGGSSGTSSSSGSAFHYVGTASSYHK